MYNSLTSQYWWGLIFFKEMTDGHDDYYQTTVGKYP